MNKPSRTPLALPGILLLAFALRFAFSWNYPIWLDAAFTVEIAKYPLGEMLVGLRNTVALPTSYIIYHIWMLVSAAPAWVKLCPITFGVLNVWMAFVIGNRLFGRSAALLASLCCAVSPVLIDYDHFMRHPTFSVFLGLCLFNLTLKIIGVQPDGAEPGEEKGAAGIADWAAFLFFMIAFLYIHYYSVFWIASLNAVFFLYARNLKKMMKWIGVQVLAGLAFLPQLKYLPAQSEFAGAELTAGPAEVLKQGIFYMADIVFDSFKGITMDIHLESPFSTALKLCIYPMMLLAAWSIVKILRSPQPRLRRGILILLVSAATALASGFAFIVVSPGAFYTIRYFTVVAPVILIAFSGMLVYERSLVLKYAAAVLLAGSLLMPLAWNLHGYSLRPTLADAMVRLGAEVKDGDVVLLMPHHAVCVTDYYLGKMSVPALGVPQEFDIMEFTYEEGFAVLDKGRMERLLDKMGQPARVWLLRLDRRLDFDPEKILDNYLAENFNPVETVDFVENFPRRGTLALYSRKPL